MPESSARPEAMLAWGGLARGARGLGPGRRTVVWVAGCRRACSGCIAPELQEEREPDVAVRQAAAWITADPAWDGALTISGGEPFNQSESLIDLLELLAASGEIEVLVYTGYRLEELESMGADVASLLTRVDMLIDGEYREELSSHFQWRGSNNQRIHCLSENSRHHEEEGGAEWPASRPLGLQWIPGFGVRVVGIPRRGFRDALRKRISLLTLDDPPVPEDSPLPLVPMREEG